MSNQSSKRSSELRALDKKYEELGKRQPVQLTEPQEPKRERTTISDFVETSARAAEEFETTGWIRGAPK
ncbi:hypothetical protein COB80_01425 [Candidatus Kaiserbacteria bacterium]|nr:MAG: hypothetical protein COB80_01425 [Candidatus Kaiserbacteria bacterium]